MRAWSQVLLTRTQLVNIVQGSQTKPLPISLPHSASPPAHFAAHWQVLLTKIMGHRKCKFCKKAGAC